MKNFTSTTLLLIGFVISVKAQYSETNIDMSRFTSYRLNWENDVMMQTDHYYTQGMAIDIVHPALAKNPINLILIKPKYFSSIYGLSIHQETFTPTNIKSEAIQHGDRPYAGNIYIKSYLKTANFEKKILISSEFDIGFIGPNSFAGITQYRFHEFSNNHLPLGWYNEISETPIINYNVSINKGLYIKKHAEIHATSSLRLGTMYDDISLGFNSRFGIMNPFYETLGEAVYNGNNKIQTYININPSVRYVAYNATLQGNMFVGAQDTYIIMPSELERFVYSINGGFTFMYKNVGASFHMNWQSPEFKSGLSHIYHSLNFIFNF